MGIKHRARAGAKAAAPEPSSYCSLLLLAPATATPTFFFFFNSYSHMCPEPLIHHLWLVCEAPLQTTFSTCLDLLWRHASQK